MILQESEAKFDKWLENLPDFEDMRNAAFDIGELESAIIHLKRDIKRADDEVLEVSANPRSNDTRIARNKATSALEDKLAALEGKLIKKKIMFDFMKFTKDMSWIIGQIRSIQKPGRY